MNLLEAIKPYEVELNAFEKLKSMSNGVVAGKLVDLWDEFKNQPENAVIIFGSSSMRQPKTNKSCSSCVNTVLGAIVKWRKHLIQTANPVFRGDADKPVMDKPKITEVKVTDKVNYSEMKFQDLKKIASDLGCKFTPSTKKPELIKLIEDKKK